MSTSTLPEYIDNLGLGQQSVLPPGVFTGVKAWIFGALGDAAKMQALADRYLAQPTNGAVTVQVPGPLVLFMFTNGERLTSPSQPIGWTPYLEFTVAFPVILRQPSQTRLMVWSPMVLIEGSRGMVTGRESWGWFKGIGDVSAPREISPIFECRVDTLIFPTFDPETPGSVQPLVRVAPAGGSTPSLGEELLNLIDPLAHTCAGFLKLLAKHATDVDLFFSLVRDWEEHTMPAVNLKQFRDVADGTKACYQAITTCPLVINTLRSLHRVASPCQIHITPCASHQLIEQLGFPGQIVPAEFGMLADMDLSAVAGEVLWSAS